MKNEHFLYARAILVNIYKLDFETLAINLIAFYRLNLL